MKKKKKEKVDIKSNKKHIFRKILLGLLVIVLLLFIISRISNFITNIKINKFRDNISSIEKEKISYVFIEINPSLVLTMKNGKVSDVACLNDDCIEIYNDIDIKGKSIDESIDNLYNLSKEKGYDVSNGVKVKTTDKIEVKEKEHISIEYIDNTTKNELLSNIKNNEDIKNNNNDNYYANLWEELRKDEDYGIVYECNMNNEELECYIKKDFVISTHDGSKNVVDATMVWSEMHNNLNRIYRVLKKFGINVKEDGLIYNNPIGIITYNGVEYKSPEIYPTPEKIDYSAKIRCDVYRFKLTEINLMKPNSIAIKISLEDDEVNYNINPYIESYSHGCGANYCLKIIYDDIKMVCDEELGWIEESNFVYGVPPTARGYELCDINLKNCKSISKEEYDILQEQRINDGY